MKAQSVLTFDDHTLLPIPQFRIVDALPVLDQKDLTLPKLTQELLQLSLYDTKQFGLRFGLHIPVSLSADATLSHRFIPRFEFLQTERFHLVTAERNLRDRPRVEPSYDALDRVPIPAKEHRSHSEKLRSAANSSSDRPSADRLPIPPPERDRFSSFSTESIELPA